MSVKPKTPSQSIQTVTHGCRLNSYESEAMRHLGTDAGLGETIIVNSCAVTAEAVRQTRQSVRRAKRKNPDAAIIVTGCAAQIDSEHFAAMREVDAVLGNHEKLTPVSWRKLALRIPAKIASQENASPAITMVNDIMSVRETAPHMIDGYGDRARAFLQIQNGCDHRCTFCIIPYGRGNSRSVPVSQVIEQAQRLVDAGHKEIVLTGVDITSYGSDLPGNPSLSVLVAHLLDQVPDLFRLRLSSIDVAEIDASLFDRITSDERIAPYLHLSLQSGDNMILKRMKRRHTREQAIEFCEKARKQRPGIAFGADIITGFPTETDDMFANSLALVEDAGLQYVHVFPYSPREGTPAARMPQLHGTIIKERAAALRNSGREALHHFLDNLIGQTHTAIAETGGRARLGNFATTRLGTAEEPGTLMTITINGRAGDELTSAPANQTNQHTNH